MFEVAPEMGVKAPPPELEYHCTVAAGLALASAVKVTVSPTRTVWLAGLVVRIGAKSTVSATALLVTEPALLVKTASYWLLLYVLSGVKL